VCACVCVCARARERERERESARACVCERVPSLHHGRPPLANIQRVWPRALLLLHPSKSPDNPPTPHLSSHQVRELKLPHSNKDTPAPRTLASVVTWAPPHVHVTGAGKASGRGSGAGGDVGGRAGGEAKGQNGRAGREASAAADPVSAGSCNSPKKKKKSSRGAASPRKVGHAASGSRRGWIREEEWLVLGCCGWRWCDCSCPASASSHPHTTRPCMAFQHCVVRVTRRARGRK
jgi:hypothetical protein